ncbi:MAG: hypothetical protein J3R72DRAFT_450764 [Linnemannia gamsii]|nr:MAG: hypothetical protein J3R72DRAFT_450764 [Linnemannia gamsii]
MIFTFSRVCATTALAFLVTASTTVTYCSQRIANVCGGHCKIYTGGATCLSAPGTQCLTSTKNVAICDRPGCKGSCNQFSSPGAQLDNGFAYFPGTYSIRVYDA